MPTIQWCEYLKAGSVWAYLPERPDAAGDSYIVVDSSGGTVQASGATGASITIDSVSTTLSAAAAVGAGTVSVTSASGVAVGTRYLIGASEATGGEFVTVKSISGTTLTLVRPLRLAHANATAFVGTKVTWAIPATTTTRCARNFRLEYTWLTALAARETAIVLFDVTRYCPVSYLVVEDIADLDPLLAKRIPTGTWMPSLIDRAWEILLRRVAAKVSPGGLLGVRDLTTPHGYLVRYLLAESAGMSDEIRAHRDLMEQRFTQELEAVLGTIAVDENQDSVVDAFERWPRGIPLVRS